MLLKTHKQTQPVRRCKQALRGCIPFDVVTKRKPLSQISKLLCGRNAICHFCLLCRPFEMIKRQLNQFSINHLLYCLYGSSSRGELSLAVKIKVKFNWCGRTRRSGAPRDPVIQQTNPVMKVKFSLYKVPEFCIILALSFVYLIPHRR